MNIWFNAMLAASLFCSFSCGLRHEFGFAIWSAMFIFLGLTPVFTWRRK